MKNTFIILIFALLSIQVISQNVVNNKPNLTELDFKLKRHTVYAELFGTNIDGLSVNYNYIFFNNNVINLSSSIGTGVRLVNSKGFSVPFSTNVTFSPLKNNHFEIGLGLTYTTGCLRNNYENEQIDYLLATYRLAYKYQRPEGGLFFKLSLGLGTILYQSKDIMFNGLEFVPTGLVGLSIGHTF